MIDLHAEIRPGVGAAGFRLGSSFSELDFGSAPIRVWNRSQGQSASCSAANDGWMRVEHDDVSFEKSGTYELRYHAGIVDLQFSKAGIIYDIFVFSGYRGAFNDTIRIGDRLDAVTEITSLFYDSGDEMHFPLEGSAVRGIAFVAEPLPLEEQPDQVIVGMSVHDWLLRGD